MGVWDGIYTPKIKADLAIYGSSRAWVHVKPTIIDAVLRTHCYNLGIEGYPFNRQYFRHKEYFEHNSKPRSIILMVDWHSLALREDLYNPNQFLPNML